MTQHTHTPDHKSGKSIITEFLLILILLSGIAITSVHSNFLIKNQSNTSLTNMVKAESKSGKKTNGKSSRMNKNQEKTSSDKDAKSDLKSGKSGRNVVNDSDKKSGKMNTWVRYGVPIGLLLVLLCGLLISIENEMEEKKDSD